jgi:CRP-like cAMP-binding protein
VEYLNQITPLDPEYLVTVLSLLDYKKVKKKELLLVENQITSECYFVLKGCLRSLANREDGAEVTISFYFENQ